MNAADRALSGQLLTARERGVLEQARRMPLSYGVRLYACPGPEPRLLVVLGEAHLKLEAAWLLGREIVGHFALRGVETFQRRQVLGGSVLGVLITAPRVLLRELSGGLVKGSTITDARALAMGTTVEIERTNRVPLALHVASLYLAVLFIVLWAGVALALLQTMGLVLDGTLAVLASWLTLLSIALELHTLLLVPALLLRRRRWSWLIHPAVGLVASRDMLMAEGTARMLRDHPQPTTALVIMGRAHLPGFERELVEAHGFQRVEL